MYKCRDNADLQNPRWNIYLQSSCDSMVAIITMLYFLTTSLMPICDLPNEGLITVC